MKKVLLVATVQSHIAQFHKPLMQLLKENGWVIHVAARNNLAEKNGLQMEYPDRVFNIPFQRSPFDTRNFDAYRQLKQVLAENQYDVVHCNTPVGGILGRLAARKYRKTGTQVYYTAHGFHFYKGAPKINWLLWYPIEKWMTRYTDKLITINQEDYDLASRKFNCPVYRSHGVGVDEKRYIPSSEIEKDQMKRNLDLYGPVILSVGELLPNKNQKMAIRMMEYVIPKSPQAILVIAGNGPEEKKLKEYARKIGVDRNVYFIGYCTNLEKYQSICNVLTACSKREGLPLNIVESMLSETPVVASDNRGHRELIENGVTGFLVKYDDINTMAEKVLSLISDEKLSKRITEAAKKKAVEYSAATVKKELCSVYGL